MSALALSRLLVANCLLAVAAPLLAAAPSESDQRGYDQAAAKAINYLAVKGQAEDGSFSAATGPGVTALVATGLMKHGRTAGDPVVAKSLKYLAQFVQPSGGVHQPESLYRNYETALAILCFTQANVDGRYDTLIRKAEAFIRELQWDEGEGLAASEFAYGGAGYGRNQRPDLSNTAFFIDALIACGSAADDEALRRALVFVSRCQNLESPENTTPFGAKNPDGGFYYTPAAGGQSQAGTTPAGGLRSYGSMTYAGLKSMIYAGVTREDPRVQAAVKWLRQHYDLKSNPGMDDAGLYYYYHTLAKALSAYGEDPFLDDHGQPHDWRKELVEELAQRQLEDGSWLNANDRWMEGDPNLVTGYALLTLAYCRPASQ